MIRAAIIDDGVSTPLQYNYFIHKRSIRPWVIGRATRRSHADICYDMIGKYFTGGSSEVEWLNLKIFSDGKAEANVRSLLEAFQLCSL